MKYKVHQLVAMLKLPVINLGVIKIIDRLDLPEHITASPFTGLAFLLAASEIFSTYGLSIDDFQTLLDGLVNYEEDMREELRINPPTDAELNRTIELMDAVFPKDKI